MTEPASHEKPCDVAPEELQTNDALSPPKQSNKYVWNNSL
jgi:hypothetical protein